MVEDAVFEVGFCNVLGSFHSRDDESSSSFQLLFPTKSTIHDTFANYKINNTDNGTYQTLSVS